MFTSERLTELGLDPASASSLAGQLQELTRDSAPERCWGRLRRELLTPEQPFALHEALFQELSARWDPGRGRLCPWQVAAHCC